MDQTKHLASAKNPGHSLLLPRPHQNRTLIDKLLRSSNDKPRYVANLSPKHAVATEWCMCLKCKVRHHKPVSGSRLLAESEKLLITNLHVSNAASYGISAYCPFQSHKEAYHIDSSNKDQRDQPVLCICSWLSSWPAGMPWQMFGDLSSRVPTTARGHFHALLRAPKPALAAAQHLHSALRLLAGTADRKKKM